VVLAINLTYLFFSGEANFAAPGIALAQEGRNNYYILYQFACKWLFLGSRRL
jgi:hypothetical protein